MPASDPKFYITRVLVRTVMGDSIFVAESVVVPELNSNVSRGLISSLPKTTRDTTDCAAVEVQTCVCVVLPSPMWRAVRSRRFRMSRDVSVVESLQVHLQLSIQYTKLAGYVHIGKSRFHALEV